MSKTLFVEPEDDDVLCGRGGVQSFRHPGNKMLRALTVLKLDDYLAAQKKSDKTKIIQYVIHTIFRTGGRFLKYDSDAEAWYDGGLQSARVRVGVAFRDANSPNKKKCVRDLQAELVNLKERRKEEAFTHSSQTNNHALMPNSEEPSRPFSFLSVQSQIVSPNALSTRSTQPGSLVPTTMLTTKPQTMGLSSRGISAIVEVEPCPLDSDDENIGAATASFLLEALSCADDEDFSYSWLSEDHESLTNDGDCKDSLIDLTPMMRNGPQQYDSNESSYLTDLVYLNLLSW